jgi:protease I
MKIACLLASGFEDSEFSIPQQALEDAGHQVTVIGIKKGEELKGKQGKSTTTADKGIADVRPEEFEALFLPGGHSPDTLRADDRVVAFVQKFYDLGRPILAICHGPQLLLSADRYKGYKLTAWKTVLGDLQKAGADVVDLEVVADGNVITSRKPDDIPAFVHESLKALDQRAAA